MSPRFLQIHTLHSYPAALLNRDDSGLAKRIPFGGTSRTRISSQCLKRHWRIADDEFALKKLGVPMGVRSREIFGRRILTPLVESGINAELAEVVVDSLMRELFQESAKATKAKENSTENNGFSMNQAVLLGEPEITYLLNAAKDLARVAANAEAARSGVQQFLKEHRANLRALKHGAGLEAALFGRMVTSDILARTNAAIHVSHAFTVHAEQSESDYFTVVDDLTTGTEETGSAGIFDVELTSGLYYGYVVVDVPLLVANLGGETERPMAAKVVEHLGHLIATVSPGAKLGSTAPYSWAQIMLIEAGNRQPRTLANAFHEAVKPTKGTGMLDAACGAMADHVAALDGMYGVKERRWLASISATEIGGAGRGDLDSVIASAARAVAV